MDNDEVLARFDREGRQEVPPDGPGAVVERVGAVVRHDGGEHGWNGVLWSDLDEHGADAAIAEQVRHFGGLGREFEWKHYSHDHPADLPDRLRAAGFTPEPPETLMVAEAAALAGPVELPEGIRLRTETDRTAIELLGRTHVQAFGSDGGRLTRRLLDQLAQAPDSLEVVVALAGDEPVSGARLELLPGTSFAGLWGGGTAPQWRGRGIYRALVAHRARIAVDRGYRYLQVDASDQSRPILARLGFAALSVTTPFNYQP
ncbi:GNAT family N-acetyltransferase [Kitasatospora sp. NBC_01287]|uniref:GNAT family N-acetyltransferase n=1 Tax=Kitasatospora sp. NBC_01287 TaxID=2903573 RepID=UPI00225AFC95|nr:GNAT family N-acetyltransferase [Kitasatospora sp. NBC_01287]MCX4750142.1 GNAT family N-acetyltransferase [Kitasatospora sp. NBC_01287]